MAKQDKKRDFPTDLEDHQQPPKKITTSQYSFLSEFQAELFSPESLSYFEDHFLRPLVREVAEKKVDAYFNLPQSSSSNQVHDQTGEGAVGAGSGSGTVKLNQVHDQTGEGAVGAGSGSETVKLKLCFLNDIPSIIFTNNQIEAENAQPLQLGLCDTTNNVNNIIALGATHPLSSALIEFVVLDGDFVSAQQREDGVPWTVAEFDKSVFTQRAGEKPSLVGNDKTTSLKNGAALINDLTFTQNSSRTRTKMFRLGAKIIDHEILVKYSRIGEAVSNPFRVKEHREANKKHHPPKGEDEVYRLEGISKDGERHKRLSSNGIETVDDFVKAHERDRRSLRKLLGKKLSEKKWSEMVKHASEYVPSIPTFDPSFRHILVENEVVKAENFNKDNLEITDPNIIHPTTNGHGSAETFLQDNFNFICEDYWSLLSHGEASTSNTHNYEVENTNTYNQNFQGSWTKNPGDANGWS